MSESMFTRLRYAPDWRWVLVSYCWLVLFHMFPTFLLGGLRAFRSTGADPTPLVWFLFGLVLVSMVIGYRSKGFTVLEPAIAGFFYALTVSVGFDRFIGTLVPSDKPLAIAFWALLSFVLCVVGSWIGELIQDWGQRRREATSSQ